MFDTRYFIRALPPEAKGRLYRRLSTCYKEIMEPVVNLEETIGKTVGKRVAPTDSLSYGLRLQETMAQIYGRFPIRKGVYRFNSHEEADEWMMRYLAQKKTS